MHAGKHDENIESTLLLSKETQSELQRKEVSLLKTSGQKPCATLEITLYMQLVSAVQHSTSTLGRKSRHSHSFTHSLWTLPSFPVELGISQLQWVHSKERRFWKNRQLYFEELSLSTMSRRSQQILLRKPIYKHEVLSWQGLRAEGFCTAAQWLSCKSKRWLPWKNLAFYKYKLIFRVYFLLFQYKSYNLSRLNYLLTMCWLQKHFSLQSKASECDVPLEHG